MSASVFSPMRRVFNAYTGVGSVYVAVATYENYSAAYVPAFSYACHPIVDPDSCKILCTCFITHTGIIRTKRDKFIH